MTAFSRLAELAELQSQSQTWKFITADTLTTEADLFALEANRCARANRIKQPVSAIWREGTS